GPLGLAADALRRVGVSAVEYVLKLSGYLLSSRPLGILAVSLAAVGAGVTCVREWRRHTALVLTTLAAGALTLIWPFAQGRLLLPLLPLLGLLVAVAAERGIRRTPARSQWGPRVALGLIALAVVIRQVELRDVAAHAYQAGVLPPAEDFSPTLTLAVRSRFIFQVNRGVAAYTGPRDRIMVDAPAAVYLYTGRQTVAAQPTESHLAESVFAEPGAYLAGRILRDSVTVIVWAPPGDALERDLRTVLDHCPQVLRREPLGFPAFYRVVERDTTCLRARIPGVEW
ncbi:MAG: hypothetical protein ACREL9_13495, partial [Gemmatimonadales bacterium]